MLGELIGPYKVVRLLGEGGMGQVYEGTQHGDDDHPLRRAAIKVLRTEYISDRQMAGRFLNEARAIDVVDHPGIVKIYDIGVLPSGAPYIAMEYLDGDSLRARLLSQGVTATQALRIAERLAQTLAAVHAKKIIHRDLKPENVMLLPAPLGETLVEGPAEQVKVLDFGIAKVLQNTHGDGQIRTRTGVMIGTPTYMAPEQCGGDGEVCDRTDVYALGIMLYEMLAGRPPFTGDQDAQIIGKQLFQPPTPLQNLAPSVDAALAALVHRMLVKDSAARPAMREVAAELGALRQAGLSAPDKLTSSGVVAQTVHIGDSRRTTLGQATGQLQESAQLGSGVVTQTVLTSDSLRITLGQATGQLQQNTLPGSGGVAQTVQTADGLRTTSGPAPGQLQKGALRPLHLLVAAGLVLVAGVGGLALSQGHRSSAAATQPATRVRWHIQSAPPGAAVIAEPDGQVLGQTPLDYTATPAPGAQAVVLRQRGFAERRLLLSRSTSEERSETLDPEPPKLPVSEQAPATSQVAIPPPATTGPVTKAKPVKSSETVKPSTVKPNTGSASKPTVPKRTQSPLRNEQVPLFR